MHYRPATGLRRTTGLAALAACFVVNAAAAAEMLSETYDLWIKGGLVHDGTGAPPVAADLLVRGDRIVRVGQVEDVDAKRTIDAVGKIVAPGFIDAHSHGDPLQDESFANFALQGVTSVLLGQDGNTPGYASAGGIEEDRSLSLAEWMDKAETVDLQTNVMALVGHGSLRWEAGVDVSPVPTAEQTEAMHDILREGLKAGAFGMSSGLEYVPGRFAHTDELVALADIVGRAHGVVMSHMRSEDADKIVAAVNEAIAQGEQARVHISHLKIVFPESVEEGDRIIDMLDAARERGVAITADVYPYLAGFGDMSLLYPPWAKTREAWNNALATNRSKLEAYLRHRIERRGGADAILLVEAPYTNKTLEEVAAALEMPVVDTVIDVLGFGGPSAAHFNMRKDVQDRLIAWEHASISTDGGPSMYHPRSWGTYPKVLGEYVRDRELIPMSEAIRKMTGLPASIIGLPRRGQIKEGYYADIVIFSPDSVRSKATWAEPAQAPVGIDHVIVNGCVQVDGGRLTSQGCGRLLRKANQDKSRQL